MTVNRLREIAALGQSLWLDNLSRVLLEDGDLVRLIEEDGLTGLTSNPTIFEKAFADSDRYEDGLAEASDQGWVARETFFELALRDVREAADLLRPAYDAANGQDGHVSFELPPEVADDARESMGWAKRLVERIDRPNVLIKVPATAEGVVAFERLTAEGVSVNVTLLFDVRRYEDVAEAYVRGLTQRLADGEPIDRIASVASFFVSRVDAKVDARLDELGREDLKGRAAVANARIAYESFQRIFAGPEWEKLATHGANLQRPLWASTSTKDPEYRDVLYVEELIGPHTVNTMPDATIDAARDHAEARRTIDHDLPAAHALMAQLRKIGVDIDDIVGRELVEEGVAAFTKSFDSMLETLGAELEKVA